MNKYSKMSKYGKFSYMFDSPDSGYIPGEFIELYRLSKEGPKDTKITKAPMNSLTRRGFIINRNLSKSTSIFSPNTSCLVVLYSKLFGI